MSTFPDWPIVVRALALAVPGILLLAGLAGPRRRPLERASLATGLAVVLAALVAASGPAAAAGPSLGVRLDLVTRVMLLLVTSLGFLIVRYSRSYLAGDPGAGRYARWILLTLGAVTTLVVARNLLVIALAWTATSLALHHLLTFYDRAAALVAAHKKFLASRLADLFLLGAIVLVRVAVGSLDLDAIAAFVAASDGLPTSLHVAAVLFAVAACMKSAQLPLHGWLTQVMEAPTPVSALLHAGVVNIGGFLMIRLAPLMAQAPAAQLVLVVVGTVTAVLAALIMTTRVSIKVALAWSTCAQMGFMLVQCGLGAWHLALLHLVAHSLYKAHAFLASGGTVDAWRASELAPSRGAVGAGRVALTAALTLGAAGAVFATLSALTGPGVAPDASTLVLVLVVALSLVPMLGRGLESGTAALAGVALRGLGVAIFYFGGHALAARMLPLPAGATASSLGWLLVGAAFSALFVLQTLLQVAPAGRLARTLHPWLFAGLYLDERFTRLTFRLWPPRLKPRSEQRPMPALEATEA